MLRAKDFISKLSIALKEAHETEYWLMLLKDTGYIEVNIFTELSDGLTELLKMLVSSIKTTKEIQNN